jgi:hypothetical protein
MIVIDDARRLARSAGPDGRLSLLLDPLPGLGVLLARRFRRP